MRHLTKNKGKVLNIAPKANPYAKPTPMKCYQRGQPRNRSNECKHILITNDIVETDEDEASSSNNVFKDLELVVRNEG